ncbi:MAG TPA: type III-B CRISPR module RAMP protein Cmr6 [Terriglobales bacterium]|nr:type III-B CRISPR module RAMP protein Cmr6 [Terriglobales bacterium]
MRRALRSLNDVPEHLGLAYDAWAPVGDNGKVAEDERASWLSRVASKAVSADYRHAFERWRAAFRAPGDRVLELELASRLLVGHGNGSAVGMGITVHQTWGVPMVPGTALKGLLAHYVDAVYGPDEPMRPPWAQQGPERARGRYQGVAWNGRRIGRGPGEVYRAMFGAPEAEQDGIAREHGFVAGASSGLIAFHDALYVPRSAPDDKPFATDVLTVHQGDYYNSSGATWPNDYDDPNPVGFITVRPGIRLLLALSGPADWTSLAEGLLTDALREWGAGGKTSTGYGRLLPPSRAAGAPPDRTSAGRLATPLRLRAQESVDAVLLEKRTMRQGWRARHEASGLSGPVQNSGDVPQEKKPGDHITLIVASVNSREIAFRHSANSTVVRRGGKGKGSGSP